MVSLDESALAAWAKLPFIQTDLTDASAVRSNFWSVSPSGDWAADGQKGRAHAAELVSYIRETGDIPMLARVAAAMPPGRTGIENGFFAEIAECVVQRL